MDKLTYVQTSDGQLFVEMKELINTAFKFKGKIVLCGKVVAWYDDGAVTFVNDNKLSNICWNCDAGPKDCDKCTKHLKKVTYQTNLNHRLAKYVGADPSTFSPLGNVHDAFSVVNAMLTDVNYDEQILQKEIDIMEEREIEVDLIALVLLCACTIEKINEKSY